ncbi:MAG TPA: Crp/Fnr family transcriptional regulator [Gemmatimonadales bacterium]|nr:Crp/Fnr family transcriptional regulator [Gemmatimonadales bacterium]
MARLVTTLGVRRRYARGAFLFQAGQEAVGIHVILEGRVRVARNSPGGRRVVVHHETAGGMLGELPLFDGGVYPATATAAEPTVCALLLRGRVLEALRDEPDLAWFFLQRLARRLREVIGRLDSVATLSVAARLARHLLERRQRTGATRLSLGMTQEELAEDLGTVREVIVRELRLLCRAGILKAAGSGRYDLLDHAALASLAAD